jgi:hypothetical protein
VPLACWAACVCAWCKCSCAGAGAVGPVVLTCVPAAAVCGHRRGSAWFLFGLRVAEHARGKGVARALMVSSRRQHTLNSTVCSPLWQLMAAMQAGTDGTQVSRLHLSTGVRPPQCVIQALIGCCFSDLRRRRSVDAAVSMGRLQPSPAPLFRRTQQQCASLSILASATLTQWTCGRRMRHWHHMSRLWALYLVQHSSLSSTLAWLNMYKVRLQIGVG